MVSPDEFYQLVRAAAANAGRRAQAPSPLPRRPSFDREMKPRYTILAPQMAPLQFEVIEAATLEVDVAVPTPEGAQAVLVLVPIDTALFEVVAPGGGTFDPAAQVLRWSEKDLAALAKVPGGGAVALQAQLKVKATAPDGAVAKMQAVAREGETKISYPGSQAELSIAAVPTLRLRKTAVDLNGGTLRPLDTVRYTLQLSVQGGTAAQHLQVNDPLDTGLEFVAASDGGVLQGGSVVWPDKLTKLAALLPGQTVELTLEARVKAGVGDGTLVSNQAQAKADALVLPILSDDPAQPGEADPTVLQVRVQSALGASVKSVQDDNGGPLLPGDTLTWRLVVVATSAAPVTGVVLQDAVPAGTDYLAGSTTLGDKPLADVGGQSPLVAGLALGSLQPGVAQAATVTFRTRVRADAPEGALVHNLATAWAEGVPPTPVGPAQLTVGAGPSLRTARKSVQVLDLNGNGRADPGELLEYTVVVRNSGFAPATEVRVTDPVPAHARYVGGSLKLDGQLLTDATDSDAGQFAAEVASVSLGTLQPGQERTVTLRLQALDGPSVANQAVVRANLSTKNCTPPVS